ncbi:lysis system i-spanin subunit Rz [Pseudomonas viridiflava]|uniref:lysis system i-spanin subunit Rz n=1 Tax=Pseudomonas viridiflava TaxID=33069 RepID=UPI0010BFA167|nr:lysis system i-spanin subunit Rz [Pseudomonas viridiflava]MBD8202050.1 lysis protein [Pseudomonas viridiflava]TKJ56689.1 lysis protein [Pseudomonas viridiflava]TKK29164.1 lysis protein [Pseudomonas viridiflava]
MNALALRFLVGAVLLGSGLGAWLAWEWQATRYERQLSEQAMSCLQARELASKAAIDQQTAEQARRRALEIRLQNSDATLHKELSDAQDSQVRLRDRLATADLRLSVLLATPSDAAGLPAAPDPGGVVHGGTRAELDRAAAQRIVAITDEGDWGLIALKACQAYVRESTF